MTIYSSVATGRKFARKVIVDKGVNEFAGFELNDLYFESAAAVTFPSLTIPSGLPCSCSAFSSSERGLRCNARLEWANYIC